ncbi:MAG: hypothetical protein JO154_21475 [Chitinophaga sp.]|uniref:DUF7009 family protein n=1 Tax=Chitinophaga sp. TaxID=1869181 RepID=UPI0025B91997|nr:hypothetical protein [Chitinophaga sp.]MBV8255187.1 hypothetical protein [Chitinophaga sp.]
MKVRLRGNSIRFRLDKLDMELLETVAKVESITHIGADTLHFVIRGKDIPAPLAKLEHDGVHVLVPIPQLELWISSGETGFSLSIPNEDGSTLQVLVEKDFKCLTDRDEDDSQSFDNPMASKNC